MISPSVSVVIPAYNEGEGIRTCIEGVLNQTYPSDNYEIIVVDNNSTDRTGDIIEEYPVTRLVEDEVQSSYAARNRGVKHSSGDIIAFLDADCTPVEGWLRAGVDTLLEEDADLAGGHVEFTYPNGGTPAEVFDSINNMQMELNIKNRKVAKTANLFVRASVFDPVGLFPSHLISGGDVYWTNRATSEGHPIVFAPDAVAHHPARDLDALASKQFRVGRGQIQTWFLEPVTATRALSLLGWVLTGFLPKPPHYLSSDLDRRDIQVGLVEFLRILLVAWYCRVLENLGRINYLIHEGRKQ
ncbi:glycosyltransferase [Haloferax larsenii]|uniref:Glycosyl transferase family 2 n=1 Tax=Haloferax larsenii TaxID=302484 RepID=A0A1H7SU39_HALLR|nr:glycosyltransferase [Haloferax larsenii]SEL75938.1 Glycosyl transferase family 2 [Haloferax larsenii]